MNYPNKVLKSKRATSYSNRGMNLESELNETNNYYLVNDIAVIYKKPTPITIAKVDYPSRIEAVIKEAYFKIPSTTDYNGLYKGNYIDFEAKETKKDYFPLANIHDHQIKHLQKIEKHGGISFLIVRFILKNETFLLETKYLTNFLNNNTRKSIPYEYFKENGYLIKDKYNPRIDYLSVVDNFLKER